MNSIDKIPEDFRKWMEKYIESQFPNAGSVIERSCIAAYHYLLEQPGSRWVKAENLPKKFQNVIAWTNKGHFFKTCVDNSGQFDTYELGAYEGEYITHYMIWNSKKLIGRSRERFQELIEKGWEWRAFYGGWIEGRAEMLGELKDQWDAAEAVYPIAPEEKERQTGFAIWAMERGWLLWPDNDEDEEYAFYKPSDSFDLPNDRVFASELYDLFIQQSQK